MRGSQIGIDLYIVLAVAPMLIWDMARNRSIHRAYLIWFGVNLPFAVAIRGLWGTAWWHEDLVEEGSGRFRSLADMEESAQGMLEGGRRGSR